MDRNSRIVLAALNAKYIHVCPAIYSLRGFAEEYKDQIQICEFTINQPVDGIIEKLYREKPDFLAFSCYIWNIRQTLDVCGIMRLLFPDIPIWLGGPEVSFAEEDFLREHPSLTGIMRGEGEKVFRSLMEYYVDDKGSLAQIPGILWRERADVPGGLTCEGTGDPPPYVSGDRIFRGRAFRDEDLTDMDELPFLYEDTALFRNRIIYYESSRGCPFSCSYCMSSVEKKVRFRNLEKVLSELAFFMKEKVRQVKFTDRTFNCSHERTMAIWKWLLENDNGVTNFHFEIEASLLTEDELQLLGKMRRGLVQTEIGVQSANADTLRAVCRSPRVEKVFSAAVRIRENRNMHLHLDLIAGLPFEDRESFRRSFQAVYRIHPDELQLGFLKLLRGSGLYRDALRYGIKASPFPPYEVLETAWLGYNDILRLKQVENMLETYYNSGQFTATVRALERFFEDPMSLYEALADYCACHEQDYAGAGKSRMRALELLRGFACETAPGELQQWNERAVLDLYLRENAKTRPSWAPYPEENRAAIRRFWEEEEKTGRLFPAYRGYHARQLARMIHLECFSHIGSELRQLAEESVIWVSRPPEKDDEGLCGSSTDMAFPEAGRGKTEIWLLFDYARRDPVSGNAAVRMLSFTV